MEFGIDCLGGFFFAFSFRRMLRKVGNFWAGEAGFDESCDERKNAGSEQKSSLLDAYTYPSGARADRIGACRDKSFHEKRAISKVMAFSNIGVRGAGYLFSTRETVIFQPTATDLSSRTKFFLRLRLDLKKIWLYANSVTRFI